MFWDENYHIASAQKYLNGVYFMEQHPPLGKLLAAAGEKLLHPNARTDQFIGTDYATNFPNDFSFAGYRFFSALLGWLSAPLLFLIFLILTKRPLAASLLSFLYVFDNALIVHLRGAMLEGPLMFFSVLTILGFFLVLEWRDQPKRFLWASLLFGASFGAVATTKVLGLALILLVPAALIALRPNWTRIWQCTSLFIGSFLVIYVAVWQIHFALGSRIVPTLPDAGWYQASPGYRQILQTHRNGSIAAFPIELLDSWKFVGHYNAGAPRLDLCKADENGSPPFLWPLGARTINYRWETPDGKQYRYLYLQSNPVVWLSVLGAVLLSAALLISSLLLPDARPLKHGYLLLVFTGIYVSYMIAVTMITRVLYLYHYFTPLLLGFILIGLLYMEIDRFWRWQLTESRKSVLLMIFAGLIFVAFQFYSPLTYYEPLTDAQFKLRSVLPVWELSCVNCTRVNALAVPRTDAQ